MRNVICIPANKPDQKLTELIEDLEKLGFIHIVVTDDGSGSAYTPVFVRAEELGCVIVHHERSLGKGAALRTCIEKAVYQFGREINIITAEADGQYPPHDIEKISDTLDAYPDHLVLGVRDFDCDNIPSGSRLGNKIISAFFKAGTGVACTDTQTGLRGIPSSLIPLALSTGGEGRDYEISFLTAAVKRAPLIMVPIETIYTDENGGSRFYAIKDSFLIYKEPLKKAGIGLAAAGFLVAAAGIVIRMTRE